MAPDPEETLQIETHLRRQLGPLSPLSVMWRYGSCTVIAQEKLTCGHDTKTKCEWTRVESIRTYELVLLVAAHAVWLGTVGSTLK